MVNSNFLTPEFKEAFLFHKPVLRTRKSRLSVTSKLESKKTYLEDKSQTPNEVKQAKSMASQHGNQRESGLHWLKAKALGDITKARKLSIL